MMTSALSKSSLKRGALLPEQLLAACDLPHARSLLEIGCGAGAWLRAVARQYPDHAWSYLGWAAHYWSEEDGIREFGRAEEILKQGLERPELDERLEILGALEELYGAWGKRRERREMHELARRLDVTGWPPSVPTLTVVGQGAPGGPFVRPSRNAPCWCGSGRKYKKCHFDSDEAGLEG